MAKAMRKTVVLTGMMGSGKTSIGRELSSILNVSLSDSDMEIEAAAGRPIRQIFAEDGEAFFRRKETKVLSRLLGAPPRILAIGGGAFLREENRAMIAASGVSVYLEAGLDLLWARLRTQTTRPLLLTDDPRATLDTLLQQRAPIYALADLTVRVDEKLTVIQMAKRVLEALQGHSELWSTR